MLLNKRNHYQKSLPRCRNDTSKYGWGGSQIQFELVYVERFHFLKQTKGEVKEQLFIYRKYCKGLICPVSKLIFHEIIIFQIWFEGQQRHVHPTQ